MGAFRWTKKVENSLSYLIPISIERIQHIYFVLRISRSMTIFEEIKFLFGRFVIATCCVSLPFVVFMGQLSRLFVEKESEKYVKILHDIQAVVALLMIFVGVFVKDTIIIGLAKHRLCRS